MMAPSNPLALRELERARRIDRRTSPSDSTVEQLARAPCRALDLPIDLYVESPDSLGGVVRGNELGDLIAAGRPALREVRPAQRAHALPVRGAPRRRGLCDRAGEGAPGGGRARVARAVSRPSSSAVRAAGARASACRSPGDTGQDTPESTTAKEDMCARLIIGVAALAAVVAARRRGARRDDGRKSGNVTLTLWHNYGTEGNAVATNNLVAAFEKQNPTSRSRSSASRQTTTSRCSRPPSISHTAPDLAVQWTGLFDLKYAEVPAQPEVVLLGGRDEQDQRRQLDMASNFNPAQGPARDAAREPVLHRLLQQVPVRQGRRHERRRRTGTSSIAAARS